MAYKHGTSADFGESVASSVAEVGSAVVYTGTAPVHQSTDYKAKVNIPVKLTNWAQAVSVMGYSDDWKTYTLCEAMYAHFNNPKGGVGPIYVINVADPDIHRQSDITNTSITFKADKATVVDFDMIVSTFAIPDAEIGVDYTASYDSLTGKLTVTWISKTAAIPEGPVEASYYKASLSELTSKDVIGGAADGVYKGIAAVKLVYLKHNAIPTLLAAPGFSHEYDVYLALLNAARKINCHWDAFVEADLPVLGEAEFDGLDTPEGAKAYKQEKAYDAERSCVSWPMGIDASGHVYHTSTLNIVERMRLLSQHNDIPYETPSNKTIGIVDMYFGESSNQTAFDEDVANDLNSFGINTLRYWEGSWRLWGGHTAAYKHGADIDARCIFDTNILMMMYLTNRFQRVWDLDVDKPMSISRKDSILVAENKHLSYLVNYGALIGTPQVVFESTDNPTSSLVQGWFKFRHLVTPTPQAKAIETGVHYTDAGISAYFGASTEGEV